jgi:predicted permease
MKLALRQLRAFLRRDHLDADVAEEIQLHVELRRQALMDDGMTEAEADREARREFGNVTLIRERTREVWGGSSIDTLMQDVRYGLRLIRKAPGFSAVAIASLAMGIGASTVLFSFANSFLFRPLHAANPEEVAQVFTSGFDGPPHLYGGSSYADYEVFREIPVFSGLLASTHARATLSSQERPEVVDGLLVSENYFDVLGLRPSHGRFFRPEENQTPGSHPVVVLSHDAWRRRFGGEPSIVDRSIGLNGHHFTVVGVGPPRFAGTSLDFGADFFVPAMMQEVLSPDTDLLRSRRARSFTIFGRLRPGSTLGEADAALRVAAAELFRQDPVAWRDRTGRGRTVTVLPETKARWANAGPGSVAVIFSSVMAGVMALLTIACVNVATVLLARAITRRKEIAVRLAVGASRPRMVRQMLTECALLAGAGGALGLIIAQIVAALFVRFRPDGVPPFDLTLDYRILLFSIGASLLTVVFFGLAPALQTTRPDVNAELKDTARAVRVRGWRFGLRAALVVIQVATSLALMIGAALLLRSAHAGRTVDPGFRRQDVVSVGIDLSTIDGRGDAHARSYQEAVRTAAGLPGVERVALAALVPVDGSNRQVTIRITEGRSTFSTSPDINTVGPGYFALLDIPVTQGREFTGADGGSSPPVAVVNETMARRFWNSEPVGKAFVDEETGEQIHVVGVARDLRHRSLGEEPIPMVYFCADQRTRSRMTLHLRTTVPPRVLAPALQRALHEIDRAAGLTAVETMDEYIGRMTLPQQLGAAAALATAGLEMALAVMALYGVIAFTASQRRREIGLRMALGATGRSVVVLIMHEGLVLTAVGGALGVAIALVGSAALRSLLIGIGPVDPVSYVGAALVLLVVAAAASYVPARRALRIEPSAALRSE